jgi:spermidine/putrescine transport system ATP-binding protein
LRLDVPGLGNILAPAVAGCRPGDHGLLALRPEQVRVAVEADPAWANRFPGEVRDFLYVGDVTTYQVRLDNGYTLQALMPNAAPGRARFHETGDRVMVGWSAQAGHYVREA